MKKYILFIGFFSFFLPFLANANNLPDQDRDGVPDKDELYVYFTNVNNRDTDGDGYSDWQELKSGYSPYNSKAIKMEVSDTDNDNLSDRMEINFGCNPTKIDSDSDGYDDMLEIKNGYSPIFAGSARLNSKQLKLAKYYGLRK